MLIREAADPGLSGRQRGALVRALAAAEHAGPDGRPVRLTRWTLDRWIAEWRAGGFDALVPSPRQCAPRTSAEVLEVAEALKRENPARTAAQVRRILKVQSGWAPDERTLQRHFARQGLGRGAGRGTPAVFGRFEASRPNEIWTGDALHGPRIEGRKTYLFAFVDDYSRAVVGHRWGLAEDTVRLAAALRPALASRGVPERIYVDNGSAFVDAWLLRACAKLGIHLTHSAPGRPQGRGKIERFLCATRRMVVSPVQPGGTRREVPGSDGLPDAERLRGQEHARKPEAGPSVRDGALGDPRDMAKAGLPESQSPEDGSSHPPERRLKPAPALLDVCEVVGQPPGTGAMPSEGIQGDEWDA